MNELIEIKKWYLSNFAEFEKRLNGEKSSAIHQIRKDALAKFEQLDFPTTRNEEWKYTNISPLLQHNFVPSFHKGIVEKEFIKNKLFDELEHSLIVFVNGCYSEEHSKLLNLPKDVIVGSIAEAIKSKNPVVLKHFSKYADHKNHIFTALSTAYTKDGAFIYVPEGKIVEEPIHIIFVTSSSDVKLNTNPRNIFIAEKNSQATIIEHYIGAEDSTYFTNAVTEIFTGENAVLDHIKLQEASGGNISRNDFNTIFTDEGGECTLNGLFITNGTQLFDVHSLIDHAMPHCSSYEHYKGILDEKSRGVFNGKVIVRKDAQKTNAFQENNNILLSTEALVNTKPQLEIFADDVKCSHGATIGQLDEEARFYLKSRGIGEETTTSILLRAFASDVLTSIKVSSVRNYLEKIINERIHQ
jgi:Fe-S cluster assembly protein SufD